jgi:hypothetical protein
MKPIASMEEYEKAEARDDYIRENLYNTGDYVENIKTNAQGVIVRRGTNYVVIEDVNDKLHKSWIYDVVPMQGVISDELQEKRKKFKESYDIGHDYAKHTEKMTPGEPGYDPNYSGTTYVPSEKKKNLKQRVTRKMIDGIQDKNILQVSRKDIKEWANKTTTKDKYEERYKKDWKKKLQEDLKIMAKQSKTFKKLVSEVSPPGWKGTVKALKKKKDVDNPYALAWHMKNKGFKAHYKDSEGKPTKKAKYKDESIKEQSSSVIRRAAKDIEHLEKTWHAFQHKVINNYVYVTKVGSSKYEVWPEAKPGDPVYNKVRHIGVHKFGSKVAAMVYARKLKKDYGIKAIYDNLNKKFLYNDYLTEYNLNEFKVRSLDGDDRVYPKVNDDIRKFMKNNPGTVSKPYLIVTPAGNKYKKGMYHVWVIANKRVLSKGPKKSYIAPKDWTKGLNYRAVKSLAGTFRDGPSAEKWALQNKGRFLAKYGGVVSGKTWTEPGDKSWGAKVGESFIKKSFKEHMRGKNADSR